MSLDTSLESAQVNISSKRISDADNSVNIYIDFGVTEKCDVLKASGSGILKITGSNVMEVYQRIDPDSRYM